ncbi:beta-beta-carotene 15-15 -monooxygenase [Brachionus plicatilis]|uniref:Beta-beta-carotene 15-15-monooxygenase n=1 Tax=Brachionus plicatilis TaxID=10195 RepID=A0A3M7SQ55_BRAPC|nr:beta-beta-carotene 15-15 -monooxygenase [Brachionus plicatilis]
MESLIKNKPRSSALVTQKDRPTRIHIINKHTGEIVNKKFVTDPQFTFHYINAYELDDQILLDLSSYDAKHFNVENFSYENMRDGKLMNTDKLKALARRVKIPLGQNSNEKDEIYCEIKTINSDLAFELPVINYWRYNGLPYKYVYGANHYSNPFSIVKVNMENPKEVYEAKYGLDGFHALPSEPIFVENPEAKCEDDGVLLVMVLCEKNDFLSVLDAKDLKEIARADIPQEVKGAFTFHGFFADQLNFRNLA